MNYNKQKQDWKKNQQRKNRGSTKIFPQIEVPWNRKNL